MTSTPSVSAWTERVNREDIIDVAKNLIAIPSPSGEEKAVMDYVVSYCEANGLSYQVVSRDPNRPNVIVSIGDPSAGPTLAMNGHLDTVPVSDPDAWRTGPFEPTLSEDGKRLFGRGASDMKSSVGVMLYLMNLLKDAPIKGCLQAHVVSDEETSAHYGSKFLIEEMEAGRLQKPDYCLIGEKSDLRVRNAERGLLGVEIRFIGRASHTGTARATGINAIQKAAKAVLALEHDLDKFHPAVGKPVISVNTIHAGIAHNVVPGECTITIDRRLIPGETPESAVAEMKEILDGIAAEDPDFKYEMNVDPNGDAIPANLTDENSPLVRAIWDSAQLVTGTEPSYFVSWAGATDGRFYRLAGVDTVGFGPSGEHAHGANECVFVDNLVTQAKVYVEVVNRLLG